MWMLERRTKSDIYEALKRLKNQKAGGADGILSELLVYGADVNEEENEQSLIAAIHTLFVKVFECGTIPKEWKDTIIIPIPKKGDTSICDNNKGIALLSVVGKLFTRILAKRTQLFAVEFLTETQFGFIQGRSTIDAIFVARQITEKCIEKQESVHWLFLREAAWKLFKKIGMPGVRVGSNLSEPFNINNGLRQGCVFAPYGFLIWMHHVILTRQEALPGCGIPIRYKLNGRLNNNRIKRWNVTKVRELLFDDDEGQPHSTAKQCAEASQMTASNMRK